MHIQIQLDGQVVSTLTVVGKPMEPAVHEAKKQALKTAIDRREVSISQSLRVEFRVLDDEGKLVDA